MARTTSTPQAVQDTPVSHIPRVEEADWCRVIATEHEVNGSPDLPWAAGVIAYRQCYRNCSASEWASFRKAFDALVLKQWRGDVKEGADPKGMMDRWRVFWREDEQLEDLTMDELREFVTRPQDQATVSLTNVGNLRQEQRSRARTLVLRRS